MNRDDTPLSSSGSSVHQSAPGWKPVFMRLAIAVVFFIAALAAIVGALSRLNPRLLAQALTIFFGWPRLVQAPAIVLALAFVGAVAAGKQIIQNIQQATTKRLITEGTADAIDGTVAPDIGLIRRWVELMYGLMDRRLPLPAPPLIPTGVVDAGLGPGAPVLGAQEVDHTQPHDDVQLAPPANWVNRERELEQLTKRLLTHRYEEDVTIVIGISGIGKTALVAKAIEQIKSQRYGDSIARVRCADLHDPVAVVRKCLERVDFKRRIPLTLNLTTLQQMSEELLGGRDTLLVLDGVEPHLPLADVVNTLRTEQHSAHILITSTRAPSLDVAPIASHLHLEPMQEDGSGRDHALEFLANYAGLPSASDFGDGLKYAVEIVDALERHTFALQLIGAYMRNQLNILEGVAKDVKKLKDGVVTTGVEMVLRPVWVAMTKVVNDLPNESRTLLYAFVSAFGGTEAGRRATIAIGEALDLKEVNIAIQGLVQDQLMQSFETPTMPEHSDHQRLRIHTLLRVYLTKRLSDLDWETYGATARDALATFYAVKYIKWYDDRPDPERVTQRALSPDADNITNSLEWAVRRNQHEYVVALAHGMRRFWHDRWLNDKTQRFMPTAVTSATLLAKRAGDAKRKVEERFYQERAADLAFMLGRVYRRVGRVRDAEPLFQQDLAFRRRHRQYSAQAEALHQLAQLERSRGRMREALDYCRRGLAVVGRHIPRGSNGSVEVVQKIRQFRQAQAVLIAQQGRIERSRGNLRQADALFAQAYDLFKQTNDKLEQGVALGYRGRIARVLGDINTAEDFFDRSNALAREVYDFRGQGVIATQRGRIARTRGELDTSKRAFIEGLNKAQQVLDKQAVAVNLNYLGRIASSEGDTLEAEEKFNQALQIAREIGDRLDEGVNLGYLGRIARKREFLDGARAYFMQSLEILREVEDRRGEALNLSELALVDIESRHLIRASRELKCSLELIRLVGDKRSEGTILRYQGQLDFAKHNVPAARLHFTAALDLARAQGDAGGMREAQHWLDAISATAGQETSQRM